jgi:hypothetical protein
MPANGKSYPQGGIFTTELPAKSCYSNIILSVKKVPKPVLRIANVCNRFSLVRSKKLKIQSIGSVSTKSGFQVKLVKFRNKSSTPLSRSLSCEAFLKLVANVPQLHAGRDFNYRTSCKKLHFNLLLSCQQSTETRLAGS